MQEQSVFQAPSAVESIADNRCIEPERMGGMQTQLVGPAGNRSEFDPRAARIRTDGAPVGDSFFPIDWVVDLAWAIIWVEPKRKFDRSGMVLREAIDNGKIALAYLSFRKLAGQVAVGRGSAGQQHQPGGLHVQPVNGRLVGQIGEMTSDPRNSAILLVRSAPGNGEQIAWFVNHNQGRIPMDNCRFSNYHIRVSLPQSMKPSNGPHLSSQGG